MKNSLRYFKYMLLLIVPLAFTANAATQSDLAKEKRWEEQIVPSLMIGEPIKLKADGVEFLGLYAESSTDQSKGAVILLHGMGVHPAWPDVIEPLRMGLPEHGWHTLSLQMPILTNDAEEKDYPPLFSEVPTRVQAGVDYLKRKGISNIVISGHSTGAAMAFYYLAKHQDPVVKTFAILSCSAGIPGDARSDTLENFKKIHGVNIVDVYGSEDTEKVMRALTQRQSLAPEMHGKRYRNLEINGAGHFYREKPNEFINQLSAVLDKSINQ